MPDLISWAERFIATPSESRLGNGAIADLAFELLWELGLSARLETASVAGTLHHAVMCELGPEEQDDGLLLVTHLDTVPPGEHAAWTATGGDPFRATRDGDRLYGLGSADAKVDFVCKAFALARLEAPLRRPVRLVGTFGEEIGLLGARWLVENGLSRGFTQALIGEPSELAAVHAHKGYAVFEAQVALERLAAGAKLGASSQVVKGAAAHSSTPLLGQNAILAALDLLAASDAPGVCALAGGGAVNVVPDHCELGLVTTGGSGNALDAKAFAKGPLVAFRDAWRRFEASLAAGRRDLAFDPDRSVASLGRVALEGEHAVFRFDVRPIPGDDAQKLVAPLGEAAEISCVRANPPLATPRDAPLVHAVEAAQLAVGLPGRVGTKATCTEAGLLAQDGLHALVLGPGPSVGNVHKPNEYTRISELHRAVELYAALFQALVGWEGERCS